MKNKIPSAPTGYNTVNSFIITKDALKLIEFLKQVFGAEEVMEAHAIDDNDGLLIHSELKIGDAIVMVADRKKDWPFTPSLLQVYVDNAEDTLTRAEKLGAKIITKPTEFYGDTLSRFQDPYGNLWWLFEHGEESSWENTTSDGDSQSPESNQQPDYIYTTLLDAMKNLGGK